MSIRVFLEPFVAELLSSHPKLTKNIKIKFYRTVILLVVLYECESWSLLLREEYRLRVLEDSELRNKFGLKGRKVTGKWRRLHKEELNYLYSS